MHKTVLCPIDFSDASLISLDYAVKMAKKENLGLSVLYNFRLIQKEKDEEIVTFKRRMEGEAREKFRALEKNFPETVKEDCRFMVEVGFIADSIKAHARKNEVAFLVMDSEIGTSLGLNGRTSGAFLEDLGVPVIIVPEKKLTAL